MPRDAPQIILPALGRAHGEFGKELGTIIAPTLDLFRFSTNVVEITTVPAADSAGCDPRPHALDHASAAELVTAVERTVETGVLKEDDAGDEVFVPKSMSEQDARITLVNGFFSECLPRIRRVLDVPVPHLDRRRQARLSETGIRRTLRHLAQPARPAAQDDGPSARRCAGCSRISSACPSMAGSGGTTNNRAFMRWPGSSRRSAAD